MKEYDRVRLIVEKDCYAKNHIHKGMDGLICDPRNIAGSWLVSFDQYGELPEIACIAVEEADLEILPPSEFTIDNNTRRLEAWKSREIEKKRSRGNGNGKIRLDD